MSASEYLIMRNDLPLPELFLNSPLLQNPVREGNMGYSIRERKSGGSRGNNSLDRIRLKPDISKG